MNIKKILEYKVLSKGKKIKKSKEKNNLHIVLIYKTEAKSFLSQKKNK